MHILMIWGKLPNATTCNLQERMTKCVRRWTLSRWLLTSCNVVLLILCFVLSPFLMNCINFVVLDHQLDQVDWFVIMLQSSFLIQSQVGSHTTSAMVPTEWTESQSSQTGGLTFLVPSRAAGPGKIRWQNANEFSHFLNFWSLLPPPGVLVDSFGLPLPRSPSPALTPPPSPSGPWYTCPMTPNAQIRLWKYK